MRIEASLAFKTQMFPLGTLPPASLKLTVEQGGLVVFEQSFPADSETVGTDATELPAGDYVVTVQALDAKGHPVGDKDSKSLTLEMPVVELPLPVIKGLTGS